MHERYIGDHCELGPDPTQTPTKTSQTCFEVGPPNDRTRIYDPVVIHATAWYDHSYIINIVHSCHATRDDD